MLKPRYDAIGRCVGSKNVPAKLDLVYGNPWAPTCLRCGDVPNAPPPISEAFESFWQREGGQDEGPDKEVARQAFRSGVEWGRNNP